MKTNWNTERFKLNGMKEVYDKHEFCVKNKMWKEDKIKEYKTKKLKTTVADGPSILLIKKDQITERCVQSLEIPKRKKIKFKKLSDLDNTNMTKEEIELCKKILKKRAFWKRHYKLIKLNKKKLRDEKKARRKANPWPPRFIDCLCP